MEEESSVYFDARVGGRERNVRLQIELMCVGESEKGTAISI